MNFLQILYCTQGIITIQVNNITVEWLILIQKLLNWKISFHLCRIQTAFNTVNDYTLGQDSLLLTRYHYCLIIKIYVVMVKMSVDILLTWNINQHLMLTHIPVLKKQFIQCKMHTLSIRKSFNVCWNPTNHKIFFETMKLHMLLIIIIS